MNYTKSCVFHLIISDFLYSRVLSTKVSKMGPGGRGGGRGGKQGGIPHPLAIKIG
jgi:hypothetical protein